MLRVKTRSRSDLMAFSLLAIVVLSLSSCSKSTPSPGTLGAEIYSHIDPAVLTRNIGMDPSLFHYGIGRFESISLGGKEARLVQTIKFESLDGKSFKGIYRCSTPTDLKNQNGLYYVIGTVELRSNGERTRSEFMINEGIGEEFSKEFATIGFNYELSFEILTFVSADEGPM